MLRGCIQTINKRMHLSIPNECGCALGNAIPPSETQNIRITLLGGTFPIPMKPVDRCQRYRASLSNHHMYQTNTNPANNHTRSTNRQSMPRDIRGFRISLVSLILILCGSRSRRSRGGEDVQCLVPFQARRAPPGDDPSDVQDPLHDVSR